MNDSDKVAYHIMELIVFSIEPQINKKFFYCKLSLSFNKSLWCMWLAATNTLASHSMELITAVKLLILQAHS
jgi:hypothetical protein